MSKLIKIIQRVLCRYGRHDWTLYVGPLESKMVPPTLASGRDHVWVLRQYQVIKCARCHEEKQGSAVNLQANFERQIKEAARRATKAAGDLDHLVLTRRASNN